MKPFDLQKALDGEAVTTRDGYLITDIHYFPQVRTKFKVVAHIENCSSVDTFTENGLYSESGDSGMDLFMKEHEKWINIYWDEIIEKAYSEGIYPNRQEALKYRQDDCLTTIKLKS